MKIDTLLEVLWAATHTHRVQSRFKSRGGLLMIAPPGQLKTSLLKVIEDQPGILGLSDMTTTTLVQARDLIASNRIHTITFYDLQKLYERRLDTAQNIIGNLRALIDEGFAEASFEKGAATVIQAQARAMILAATTPAFYRARIHEWNESGFARRLLFAVYRLKDPTMIRQAIMREDPIELRNTAVGVPVNLEIKMTSLDSRTEKIFYDMLKHQMGDEVPLIWLRKVHAVLDWKYRVRMKQKKDLAIGVLKDFAEALSGEGAEVTL